MKVLGPNLYDLGEWEPSFLPGFDYYTKYPKLAKEFKDKIGVVPSRAYENSYGQLSYFTYMSAGTNHWHKDGNHNHDQESLWMAVWSDRAPTHIAVYDDDVCRFSLARLPKGMPEFKTKAKHIYIFRNSDYMHRGPVRCPENRRFMRIVFDKEDFIDPKSDWASHVATQAEATGYLRLRSVSAPVSNYLDPAVLLRYV